MGFKLSETNQENKCIFLMTAYFFIQNFKCGAMLSACSVKSCKSNFQTDSECEVWLTEGLRIFNAVLMSCNEF